MQNHSKCRPQSDISNQRSIIKEVDKDKVQGMTNKNSRFSQKYVCAHVHFSDEQLGKAEWQQVLEQY